MNTAKMLRCFVLLIATFRLFLLLEILPHRQSCFQTVVYQIYHKDHCLCSMCDYDGIVRDVSPNILFFHMVTSHRNDGLTIYILSHALYTFDVWLVLTSSWRYYREFPPNVSDTLMLLLCRLSIYTLNARYHT